MSQDPAAWRYWRKELKDPGSQTRDTLEKIAGYYRITSAKTKPSTCCAVWYSPEGEPVWSVGRQRSQAGDGNEWQEFLAGTWPKAVAVTQEEYNKALETGFWSDGKNVWKMDENERMGISLPEGDNAPPVEESLADQIASLAELLNDTPEPTTQEQANTLSGRLDKMRALLKLAEAQRVTEKEPHKAAAEAVDTKWKGIKYPGEQAGIGAEARRKAFLKKEQARLDRIAEDERKARQAEVDAENERIRQENARREEWRRTAEAEGQPKPEEAEVIPEITASAVEAPRAVAGSNFGRSSGLRKVTVLDALDGEALAFHFLETKDTDFLAYLTERAKKAIRAKVTLPGVTTKVEMQ